MRPFRPDVMEDTSVSSGGCGERQGLSSSRSVGQSTERVAVATAAVWANVYGYLTVLLRGRPLSERLPTDAGGRPVPRLLLLCPSDGRLPDDIGQLHPRLTPAGRAQSFLASVAGARSRPFGAHPVFQLQPEEGAGDDTLLLAIESVSSLRTLHVVAEAMASSGRGLPRLDTSRLVRQFIRTLRRMVERDPALRCWIRVVVYDPAQDADRSLLPAVVRAATEDSGQLWESLSPPPSPPSGAPLPVGVGVYLAWSFFHGYLALVAGRRDVSGELSELQAAVQLPLPLRKLVLLCPLSAGWTDTDADDLPALDGQLKPVQDVDGVEAGVPALAGRSYGSFSIYRSRPEGACFALELATPLRTLSLGVASEGVSPELYRSEARSFTEELQTLLREHPHVGAHFTVLKIEDLAKIHSELANMA